MSQIDKRQMLPMGTVLDHRYRIIRYLASGGFGNTYVAEDTRLGGQVAVKEFFMRGTNHRSADGTTVEVSNDTNTPVFNTQLKKFKREARRIFELQNEHIIQVFDLFDANGTSYYVMKLINGTSLAKQTLTEEDAHNVILQVLDALEAMHNAGLYHLDVKPGNIMRDANGHCTLIDFGASKQLSADERNTLSSSTMAYTPGYAPLEQTAQQSKDIGPWTDFYALGATLYRLVTGTTPPEVSVADSAPDGRRFPYPKTVSTSVRHAVSTLMNPIYTLRPQTADEVKALLEGTKRPVEKSRSKKKNKYEETVLDNPTPDFTYEKTQRTTSSAPTQHNQPKNQQSFTPSELKSDNSKPKQKSSKRRLWFGFASLVTMILLIVLLVNYGGCDTERTAYYESDSTSVNPTITYETCPDDNHPHAIDLGLPSGTKWACCNVGANKPEEYGEYYAWGETKVKDNYSWETYEYCNGSRETCYNIGSNICGTQYDAAHMIWGGSWVMPTNDQCQELENYCEIDNCKNGNNRGIIYTSKINGKSIFMPFAGFNRESHIEYFDEYGAYWTSISYYEYCAYSFDHIPEAQCSGREEGRSIRPVCK